jgi:hypothetical protein
VRVDAKRRRDLAERVQFGIGSPSLNFADGGSRKILSKYFPVKILDPRHLLYRKSDATRRVTNVFNFVEAELTIAPCLKVFFKDGVATNAEIPDFAWNRRKVLR